jgi:prepilin signal peptidase PulO-like enzyme (type II secretory pathway)
MFTLLPLAIFLCASLLQHHYEPLLSAMVVALPFALLACFSHGRGMGWGDVKMAAFAGAVLPPNAILFASFLAVGATFAISRISRPSSGTGVAFVPYFASAIGMVLLLGSGF